MIIGDDRLKANGRDANKGRGPDSEGDAQCARQTNRGLGLRPGPEAVAPDEAEAVAARRKAWAAAFPAEDGHQRWLVDQVVLTSVRIDRCQEHRRSQARSEADRALSCWDIDRDADAAALGARLSRDPDRVVSRLSRSVAGLDWLLGRWRGLADLLEGEGVWDDAQRRLCLDLMRTPAEFRDAELGRLGSLPLDALRDLVGDAIRDLEALRESAARFDEIERGLAALGLPTAEGPLRRQLRRDESALWRRYRALEASWKAARAAAVADDDAPIAPARRAAPEPESDAPPSPPRPGPPGPRPDRSTARSSPAAPPIAEAPAAPERTSPDAADVSRRVPAEPTVMLNRRARRALKKAKARR